MRGFTPASISQSFCQFGQLGRRSSKMRPPLMSSTGIQGNEADEGLKANLGAGFPNHRNFELPHSRHTEDRYSEMRVGDCRRLEPASNAGLVSRLAQHQAIVHVERGSHRK